MMANKDLIRHILEEETRDIKLELIRQIEDEGLFSVADLVGGLDNLKKMFFENKNISFIFFVLPKQAYG